MGILILILGVALWWGAHLFKRLAPERRAAMGEAGRGPVSLALLGAIVLMVVGYKLADHALLWQPPSFLRHLNNLLVFVAFYLFAASGMKTAITRKVRHPQLTGFKTWAVAHLLVVPTLAGLILFGGLLAWAVVSVIILNRATPRPAPNPPASTGKEIGALVGAAVATAAVGWIHGWLGPWPFG